jgi:hypothetical protein
MKAAYILIIYIVASLILGGCTTPTKITVSDLTVHADTNPLTSGIGSLNVAHVKSDNQSAHMREPIDTELFRQALINNTQESGLFTSVSTEAGSDFTLESEIIYQAPVDPYSVFMPLLVHYKLRETETGKVVWKKNTFSLPIIPYRKSEAGLTGALRHGTVVHAAIRDSFTQMLESMQNAVSAGL